MRLDHENYRAANLPAYEAAARNYRKQALACGELKTPVMGDESESGVTVFREDAMLAAEEYADHCESIVRMAKDGETADWIAAYDFKYGPAARDFVECQVFEFLDIFDTPYKAARELLWNMLSLSPAASTCYSPLDGGVAAPAGSLLAMYRNP